MHMSTNVYVYELSLEDIPNITSDVLAKLKEKESVQQLAVQSPRELEMLLDSADAVLAIFGSDRSVYGFDNNKKVRHWLNEIYEQRKKDIESAKLDL